MFQQQEQDPTNLYIANLPIHVTESDLETMFSPYGQVTHIAAMLFCSVDNSSLYDYLAQWGVEGISSLQHIFCKVFRKMLGVKTTL